LITDVNLPGPVTGWDIAHRARELNPGLPVIYMTGGAGHEWSAHGVPESLLVTKPFALAQVVTAVAQLMNAASSALPVAPRTPQG
jgi:FixJ family two-component response regulator